MENAPVTLAEAEVAKLLSYEALIPAMRDAFIAFSAGKVQQPVRNMLTVEEGERYFGMMPAAMPGAMGAKMVSFYPGNARKGIHTHFAAIGLFDPQHGHPIAFMDGRLITEMRTAAASAAVSEVLASPESRSLALVGSGVQALAHLQALKTVFPIDDVRVWSRTDARAQAFAAAHGARAAPLKDAVEGADIVVCATNAREPVLQGVWLKPGAHVNSVGSPRPDWRELDDAVMANAIVVDSRDAVRKESGDIILSGAEITAEAGEVLAAETQIPASRTTLFKSVGIAVQDIASARLVYDAYQTENSDQRRDQPGGIL